MVRNDQINDPEFDMDFDFSFPNIPLGSRCEYHIPTLFKFYLIKNTEIKDSIIQITGKNLAVSAGLYFDHVETLGLMAVFNAIIEYKHPVTEKLWLLSNFFINYTTISQDYYASLEAGAGYQLSKRFYATIVPSLDQYRLTNYNKSNENLEIVEELRLIVPVLVGVNITRKWSTYWRNEALCWYGYDSWAFRSMFGFQFTW